jgi:hypothetical protein
MGDFFDTIQGDSEGKVVILGGDSIGYCEKNVHINEGLILNGYRDIIVWIYKYKKHWKW